MSRHVAGVVAELEAREREIIQRLMLAAEFRDDDAGDHLTRVAGCTIAIAEGLGLSEREANDIALASTMHDIGKIGIPDSILLKPGRSRGGAGGNAAPRRCGRPGCCRTAPRACSNSPPRSP